MSYFSLEFALLMLGFFVLYWALEADFWRGICEFFRRFKKAFGVDFGGVSRGDFNKVSGGDFGKVSSVDFGGQRGENFNKKSILAKTNIVNFFVNLGEKLGSKFFKFFNGKAKNSQNNKAKTNKKSVNSKGKNALNTSNKSGESILAKTNIVPKNMENSLFSINENAQNEIINPQENSQNDGTNLLKNSQNQTQKSVNFQANFKAVCKENAPTNSQNSQINSHPKSVNLQTNSHIPKAQNIAILLFSYLVYTMVNPHFALILFVYTFFIHYFALLIFVRQKRHIFALCIAFVLLNLCFFKYFTSIKDAFDALLIALGLGYLNADIIFPVGLSFYTFASITYLVSVYKDKKIESFVNLATYLSFFPTLLMGPIMRSKDFFAQLRHKRHFTNADLILTLLLFGIVKKVFIANYLGIYSKEILSNPAAFNSLELLCGIYAFSVQIYCDFSGYVDLVSAFGLMLGFTLPLNFNMPYLAKNLRDFWKRWHISLCEFIRDYIYIPLGGSKNGKMRTYFNLLIAFALSGLWHGNSLNFIIWGLLHGFGVVFLHLKFTQKISLDKVPFLSTFLTFHFVAFAWVFFYYTNFSDACDYLKALFTNAFVGVSYANIYAFLGFIALFFSYPLFVNFKAHCVKILNLSPLLLKPLLIAFFLLLVFAFMPSGIPSFIYEAF